MIWIKCVKNTVSWHHENSQALDLSMGFGEGRWRLSLHPPPPPHPVVSQKLASWPDYNNFRNFMVLNKRIMQSVT